MRVLIADDEEGARAKIKRFLSHHPDCVLVGEAGDGWDARDQILALSPDLIFLDISMPRLDGFQVLSEIPSAQRPQVVFATAFSDRAVQAFEVAALDYLLKPFDRKRFDAALQRAHKRFESPESKTSIDQILQVLKGYPAKISHPKQLLVHDEGITHVVACHTISHIESAGNYTLLHTPDKKHILRKTLAALETELDPNLFCRVHRQFLVRLEEIATLEPYYKGDMMLVLKNGTRIKLSRRYKDALFQKMEH